MYLRFENGEKRKCRVRGGGTVAANAGFHIGKIRDSKGQVLRRDWKRKEDKEHVGLELRGAQS